MCRNMFRLIELVVKAVRCINGKENLSIFDNSIVSCMWIDTQVQVDDWGHQEWILSITIYDVKHNYGFFFRPFSSFTNQFWEYHPLTSTVTSSTCIHVSIMVFRYDTVMLLD